jgi:hypothetical protein
MSKRFKGKTCVYCAAAGASETGDHVLAREFVQVAHRPQIPQVPACTRCNRKKADLEHYVTAVLPFGGRHADATANLKNNAPKRLEKNQKLHRALARGRGRLWTKEASGLIVHAISIPIDGEKVEKLVTFIIRGLMAHHWGIVFGSDCFVDVLSLTSHGEGFFERYKTMRAKAQVKGNIGDGALAYEGSQGTDNPQVSVWKVSLYGGVKMAGADGKEFTSSFGAITGPQAVKDRAEERVKRAAFIITA